MTARKKTIIDVEVTDATHDSDPASGFDAEAFADLKDRASERLEVARSWIQHNPLPALGIALAAGFVVGRIVRR